MPQQVLIVEDDIEIANSLIKFLSASGFVTHHIDDGALVQDYVQKESPDLIVLDVLLPNKNGVDICIAIRKHSNVPILILTGCKSESERLKGLEVGADDYVCKPFSAPELVLRIKAILRRTNNYTADSNLLISNDNFTVKYGHNSIELTASEHGLLTFLHANPGKIFSRYDIIDNIYKDYRVVTDRVVDSHVRNLRKKLKTLCSERELIQSVYGAGYCFKDK